MASLTELHNAAKRLLGDCVKGLERRKPDVDCAAERTYTELEKLLIQFGFTEMFGIGLFAVSEKSVVADTNSGIVKLIPHIDASDDDFFGFYDESEIGQLELKLDALKVTGFIF